MANGEGDHGEGASKAKRVRTGCLTCRNRHLKCDEGLPDCNNCKKSNRLCKRGLRLNFIDIWTNQPPHMITLFGSSSWKVSFRDESRDIASEYQGGAERYRQTSLDDQSAHTAPTIDSSPAFDHLPNASLPSVILQQQQPNHQMPPIQGMTQDIQEPFGKDGKFMNSVSDGGTKREANQYPPPPQNPGSGSTQHSNSRNNNHPTSSTIVQDSATSYRTIGHNHDDVPREKKDYLDNQEETLFMQVFVEEVGLWMDSMDSMKHFSRLLPFHSLSEPMLLNAFLACGARHLVLVNPTYAEEKALHYYDTATRYLLKNLQNPERDTVICATTAVILNIYEIMTEKALQRMNHIAGARALIKECGWSARSQGIGAACFWLNVGLEVLSCLHFNWQVAWNPDEWGVDMNFAPEQQNGREEVWTHRMLYIIAKVCNYRATVPRYQEPLSQDQQIHIQQRHKEWLQLQRMCDDWDSSIPRTMQPMAYLHPHQTSSTSLFPEVWLVKRTTIVARLFYHTAMLLIAQIHPFYGHENPDMAAMRNQHAQMICGIVAHVKDRGVASVAIRSLAHAGETLTDRGQQEEVIKIFEKINRETGWRIGFVYKELKDKWGWNEGVSPHQHAQTHAAAHQAFQQQVFQQQQQQQQQQHEPQQEVFDYSQRQSLSAAAITSSNPPQQQQQSHSTPPLGFPTGGSVGVAVQSYSTTPPTQPRPPQGISNPVYRTADFTLPQHPYQNIYVAPREGFGGGGSATGAAVGQTQQLYSS